MRPSSASTPRILSAEKAATAAAGRPVEVRQDYPRRVALLLVRLGLRLGDIRDPRFRYGE